MSELTEAIERTLTAAAASAPVPEMSFVEEVGRRRRARRRRKTALTAAAIALVVALPAAMALGRDPGPGPAATDGRPIEELFQTGRLPRFLPGGKPYAVAGQTGPDTYVVVEYAANGGEGVGLPMLWRAGEAAPRPVGSLANPDRLTGYSVRYIGVGPTMIVWTMAGWRADASVVVEVWAAGLAGDGARRRGVHALPAPSSPRSMVAYELDRELLLTVTSAFPTRRDGTYRVDASGRTNLIAGSNGFHWPGGRWLARNLLDQGPGPGSAEGQSSNQTAMEFMDIGTGRRWIMEPDPTLTEGSCAPRWCVSLGPEGRVAYRPGDPSATRRTPRTDRGGFLVQGDGHLFIHLNSSPAGGSWLWDLERGEVGTFHQPDPLTQYGSIGGFLMLPRGDQKLIVNLNSPI